MGQSGWSEFIHGAIGACVSTELRQSGLDLSIRFLPDHYDEGEREQAVQFRIFHTIAEEGPIHAHRIQVWVCGILVVLRHGFLLCVGLGTSAFSWIAPPYSESFSRHLCSLRVRKGCRSIKSEGLDVRWNSHHPLCTGVPTSGVPKIAQRTSNIECDWSIR